MDTHKTKVIFKRFPDGENIALFPELHEGAGFIESYMHVGQHSTASIDLCYLKPAKPSEYADLFKELTSIGYNLRIMKRNSTLGHSLGEEWIDIFDDVFRCPSCHMWELIEKSSWSEKRRKNQEEPTCPTCAEKENEENSNNESD